MVQTATINTVKGMRGTVALSLPARVATVRAYQTHWLKGQSLLPLRTPRFKGICRVPAATTFRAQQLGAGFLSALWLGSLPQS